jgi:selenocysteine lyase/cysteine desulfurase
LGFEYGIAVAAGTSGANIYVQDLLGLTNEEAYQRFRSGRNYGLVRATLAPFNSSGDIDQLIEALYRISCRK